MDSVSVEENNEITTLKIKNTLAAYENYAFEGTDLIDNKDMVSSTTSTLIGGEKPENQLLDSFISTTEDDDQLKDSINQNILPPVKLSIEATLCEQAETNKHDTNLTLRGDSSEISDEELVEYPKCKENFNLDKPTQLPCTSPASQTESNVHLTLTSSTSAQTIHTSGSEYVTCKSGATSNVTSAASYLTANDSTFQHSKTLSVSNSDSTISSDSSTLIDERYTEEEPNYELLDITPINQQIEQQQRQLDKLMDLKDEEEDEDSSSTGDPLHRTIISNIIKEPYETEIPISVICNSSLGESFIRANTIEQQQLEFQKELQIIEQQPTVSQTSLSRLTPRVSLSEQSDTSIETAIYKGGSIDQQHHSSDFSSLESNQDLKNEINLRDEPMPSIMASNLDQWDTLDEEMIIHEDMENKKSDLLYTLEEEEESRTEDGGLSNKLIKDLKQQRCSSADNSSSLMEFERLEKELDRGSGELDAASNLPHHSSLDSIGSIGSTGALGTPKLSSNTPQSDNSSLNEFERLENECQEQIKKQLTEIEEGHESQASDSAETTISGCSQVRIAKEKEEDDTSEIDLELNANLDAFTSSVQEEEDLEATPIHQPHLAQKTKSEEYDEEILKIVTTTENRVIEEVKEGGKFKNKFKF